MIDNNIQDNDAHAHAQLILLWPTTSKCESEVTLTSLF